MDSLSFIGGPLEVLYRLAAAVLVGCVLGVNRDLRDKPAGLRTHALVALGAALLTVTAEELAFSRDQIDGAVVSRVIQGIMSGIGFIGGGVILRDVQRNDIHGLTTAASIWLAACLGVSCGAGHWVVALLALAFTLVVLVLGGPVERTIYRWMHGRESPRGD